jgi:2,5-dihydroxypyridine 5,6-dioxygenase
MSANGQTHLTELFRKNLELCEVGPGQTVAVLSEGDQLRDYAQASIAAARELGADVEDVHVPSDSADDPAVRIANVGQNALRKHPAAMQTCKDADMVVDHMLLLFSHEQIAMQEAGSRILLVVEPLEILERLFPTTEMRDRVEAGERRLNKASELRFTNAAGTDVTFALDGKPILTEYGYTTKAGRWDHWPGGFLATLAAKNGVNGRVVMEEDDIVFPLREYTKERIAFEIRDGWVKEISGGKRAAHLKGFMEGYNDPRAYATSHIGWGLNHHCVWQPDLPGIGMDGRAHYGNVLFSLGPDTEFGGDNDTACHLDLPMKNCTLWLDDELIVKDGDIIPEDMRAPMN